MYFAAMWTILPSTVFLRVDQTKIINTKTAINHELDDEKGKCVSA